MLVNASREYRATDRAGRSGLVNRAIDWWRGMMMAITAFSAVTTPSTGPVTMLTLAGPIWVLYFGAAVFSLLHDRRKARREEEEPGDHEISDLDLTPQDIGEVASVSAGQAPPAQPDADDDRFDGETT